MATIALLGNGMRGHFGPLTGLARVLAGHGHRLVGWVPRELMPELEGVVEACRPHEPVRLASLEVAGFGVALAEATPDAVELLVEELDVEAVELIVHDVHVPWARVAADFLGLPRIVSTPVFPGPLSVNAGHPRLPREGFGSARSGQIARVDTVAAVVSRRWGIELGDINRVIWNAGEMTVSYSTARITGLPERFPRWTFVGPLLDPPPERAREGELPLVYVSLGTVEHVETMALRVVLRALRDEPVEVLVSTGGADRSSAELGPVPDNAVVRRFVATQEVLARASVFVTHGGANSVHESLSAGVPMVCQPQGADQYEWSRRVVELGAGEWVPADPDAIRDAVRALLSDPRATLRARELGAELHRYDGEGRVDRLVAVALA